MTEMSQVQISAVGVPEAWMKVAGWCAYISGVVSIFGIVFLLLFFAGVADVFGPMNDIAIIIQYMLMLPMAVTFWLLLRPQGQALNDVALVIGVAGMLGVIGLQALLVAGVLPFSQQVRMVTPAFLVVTGWFVATGQMARSLDILPKSVVLQVLAGLFFGYPMWAFKVGQRLLAGG